MIDLVLKQAAPTLGQLEDIKMALNFAAPTTGDNYSSAFVPNIIANQKGLAQWLDSTNTVITGTPETYAKRYNRTSASLEEYNGTAWVALPLNISGSAGSTALAAGSSAAIFSTAIAAEGRFVAKATAQNDVYLFNSATAWGIYSASGGNAFTYNRTTAKFTFNGDLAGNAATATTVTNGVYTTGDQSIAGIKTFASPIVLATGTAAAPSLSFSGDTDTGLYSGGANLIYFANNGVKTGEIQALGNLIMVGNVTAYSDSRLKKDLVKIDNALDKVDYLTGYTYTRTDTGERQTGLIAQDVQRVLPEAVVDSGEYLSVAYGNIIGLLVEAIKELRQEVKDARS